MSSEQRLSVSKCKLFDDCKKRFQFAYIQKLPKKHWEFHTFGKFCHQVLENFHNAYIKDNSSRPFHVEMSVAYKEALQKYGGLMTPEMKKECYAIVNRYLQIVSHDKANNLSANVLAVEKKFDFPISETICLTGMIDRVQLDPDGVLHLADYKTAKEKKFLQEDWFQLMTYGFVMLHEDPSIQKVRCSYIMLRHDFEYLTKEFGAEELWDVRDRYLEYAQQMINETEYLPNPSVLCKFCDYLDSCPQGKNMVSKLGDNTIYGEVSW
jgi:RecB family exonuclease